MSNWSLQGKRVLITGATKGIGLAAAREMAALGAHVFVNARSGEDVEALVDALRAEGHLAFGYPADLSDGVARLRLLRAVTEKWDALDVLVNNVGMNIRKPFTEYAEAEYRRIFETNLFSALDLTRELHSWLRDGRGASVINVASVAGMVDVRSGAIYGMTKAAMIQMTRHLATEWAADGIRVNAVSPWYTRTPLAEPVLQQPERLDLILRRTPIGRIAEAEEVAAAIAFLAMDKASYITGHNLVTDGGMTASGL